MTSTTLTKGDSVFFRSLDRPFRAINVTDINSNSSRSLSQCHRRRHRQRHDLHMTSVTDPHIDRNYLNHIIFLTLIIQFLHFQRRVIK